MGKKNGSGYGAEYDALAKASNTARQRMYEIESEARAAESRALVGRAFRYLNNYSCPETKKDYWWLYTLVVGVTEDGQLSAVRFQRDKHGRVDVERTTTYVHTLGVEITRAEFAKAWKRLSSAMLTDMENALATEAPHD